MKLLNGKCIENEFRNNFVNKSCHYNSFLPTILFISDLITFHVSSSMSPSSTIHPLL